MEIFSTFDDQYQGIYLARFVNSPKYNTPLDYDTEFSKSLDQLQDPFYVRNLIKSPDSGWKKGDYNNYTLNQLVTLVLDEMGDLLTNLHDIKQASQNANLDWLLDNFIPLADSDLLHKPERVKYYTYAFKSLLRLYGVQLGNNAIIITGISIKLVKTMQDCKLLQEELYKLDYLKSWLTAQQITHCEQL